MTSIRLRWRKWRATLRAYRMQRAKSPRPWPIRAWGRLRYAIADWIKAESFAWSVYTALRHMPRPFCLERLERCTEGWVAEGVLPESGERFQGIHANPYVAIRRMSLTAQFERAATCGAGSVKRTSP